MAAIFQLPVNVEGAGEPVQVPSLRVTAGFFEILGIPPLLGHTIRAEDNAPRAPGVVVLSHGLWQRRFGGRADVIGQKIQVEGRQHQVVGIMPEGFDFPPFPHVDLYMPLAIDPASAPRDGRNYKTVARLRPGVSVPQAQSEIESLAALTARERPGMNTGWSARVVPLMEQTVGDTRTTLLVLFGAVMFVLLIACANVSNLLLMRASGRRREMAVRMALGAGRWRLVHQLITESLMLALTGGVLGFLLAYLGVPAIVRTLPSGFPLPRMSEIGVDRAVLVFTLFVSVGCGVLFGIFPALQVDRRRVNESLHRGGRHGSAGNRRLRSVLVVAEVSLAMLLVIGAGLMLRSFILLNSVDPGFRPEKLLAFRMLLLPSQWTTYEELLVRRGALVDRMLRQIRSLPQVTAASSIHLLPLSGSQSGTDYSRADRPAPPPGTPSGGDVSVVSDAYFRTMGIRLVAGREFDGHDTLGSPRVAVVNQALVKLMLPGEDPIGKRIRIAWGPGPNEVEIVGLAADVRHNGLENTAEPCLFLPQAQAPSAWASLLVRVNGDPAAAIEAVREQIHSAAPHQGIAEIANMEDVMADSIARPKLEVTVLGAFGLLALILACVGIYAVISYSVEQRSREMGIRLAMGAAPGSISRLVLREGLMLASMGIGLGVVAALLLTRYLQTLLYTITPTDPAVFAAVTAMLAGATAAGCYVPARRATRVDPAIVLREE